MNDYYVYKHTAPNGKVYIGITKQTPEQRWKSGLGYRNQKRFACAIKSYGWDAFTHEILFSGLSFDEACAKEVELIKFYKSNDPEFGYNIDGGGSANRVVGEETRQRLRESHAGVKLTEEHKRRISEGNKGRVFTEETKTKLREANVGKTMSEESREKMSKSHTGLTHSRETVLRWKESNQSLMTPVEQIDPRTNDLVCGFGSSMDAHRATGIDASSIIKCCRGKRQSAGGYKWRYVVEVV